MKKGLVYDVYQDGWETWKGMSTGWRAFVNLETLREDELVDIKNDIEIDKHKTRGGLEWK